MPFIDENDFDEKVSPKDRTKALSLIGVSKDPSKTLAEKLGINYDNSAMLSDNKKSTSERIHTLFQQQNFSPITRLIRLVKIEEAKIEAYALGEQMNLSPKLLAALPRPDKKFYAALLMQLAKYEIPELKSIEVNGQVDTGINITVVQHQPQQRIVRVSDKTPDHLKKLFDKPSKAEVPSALPVMVEVMDDI